MRGIMLYLDWNKWLLVLAAFILHVIPLSSQVSVSPLLTTSWHQQSPYNLQCPMTTVGGNTHSAAGCGAIAVSQILTKYKKPVHGYGHSYYENTSSGNMTDVDYSLLTMEWDKVKNSYSSTYSGTESEDAVASIVYQVGAAMQMSYGTSSAPKNMGQMMWGLHHFLHISPDSRYRRRCFYSTAEWLRMVSRELTAGRPVFYRGEWHYDDQSAAHIFVLDGVNEDGMFHANYGHSSKYNRFVSLNILNYNDQYAIPGGRVVCYNFGQAMITDFFPVDGLTDEDYSSHSLILTDNIFFTDNTSVRQKRMSLGGILKLKMKLRDCSLTGGATPFGIGVYQNGQLLRVLRDNTHMEVTFSVGGYEGNRVCNVTLPTDLENGQYEMKLVFSDDAGLSWQPVWDNAPNHIDMAVNNNSVLLTLSPNYMSPTHLYLREPIHQVYNVCEGYPLGQGTAFRVALRNPTVNNFENLIKFEFYIDDSIKTYEVKCPIYGCCDVDFDILIPESKINLNDKSYTYKAYYYEHNLGDYIELTTLPSSSSGDVNDDGRVSIEDVTLLIDNLLKGDISDVGLFAVDCNADGVFSISDVVALIDSLLSGKDYHYMKDA